MFQFTTTHVVNSDKDLTTNKPLWTIDEEKKTVHIKGINNFKAENVEEIDKAEYVDPVLAKVEIDFSKVPSTVNKKDTLRLSIYIRITEADQSSYYANDTRYKGRPFTIEFPWLGTAAETAANLKRIIRKYGVLVFEKEVVTSTVEGTKLVLEAVNEFQRFHVIKLEHYLDPKVPFGQEWEEIDDDDLVTVVEEGTEGFGTYGWILRNIKLPTHEHTTAWAPRQNELAIPGAHYTQYTIHYCVQRGLLGLNAVGQPVKSVTTNVFYVKDDVADAFEEALSVLGDITTVPEKASEPASASEDDEDA
jgi:hypothetical protein